MRDILPFPGIVHSFQVITQVEPRRDPTTEGFQFNWLHMCVPVGMVSGECWRPASVVDDTFPPSVSPSMEQGDVLPSTINLVGPREYDFTCSLYQARTEVLNCFCRNLQ